MAGSNQQFNRQVFMAGLIHRAIEFGKDDRGQDIVEYSLLLAFVALAGAAAYIGISRSTNTIWGVMNSRLAAANQTGS
jgi:Flp pilus assembly pilin Flp